MPDFAYTARNLTGQKISGRLTADSQHAALAALDQQALFPLEIKADKPASATWRGRRIKAQLVATAYGQLADLLRSGVPLLRSLDVLLKQTSHAGLKAVMQDVRDQVEDGRGMSESMARHPRVFSEMAISMVRAGSEGGFLEEALDRVADFTEKAEDMKSRTLGAIAYPIFLGVVGTLVVTGLMIFAVPKFEGLFARLRERGELPAPTEWLLATSSVMGKWWWVIAIMLVAAFIAARVRLQTDAGRVWQDRIKLKIPGAGMIFLNMAVARFCRVLGTLLKNGVPILKSLEISSDSTGNRVLSMAIRDAADNISSGQSLAAPLAHCKQFPPAVVEMISVAEEANTLDTVLIDIADGLERRTWRQLDLFVRLLEPLMLLVLALAVLMLAVALLLPVIKMSTTM
ncbi:MAG TPA: type II secretion system F family protein [Castellaniella sp.]|nr:type II secretion system F family protein [Castellaniella sp.]